MTKKELEALGLNEEQTAAILKQNSEELEKEKTATAVEIKNLQTEKEALTTQVKERDKQLETLKKSAGDNEDLQKQIEQLQTDNATAKAKHEAEMNQLKLEHAVEKALTSAKAKNIKAVKALLDLEDAKLDKEGNVKGLKEQIDKLVSAEDSKFLFEEVQQSKQVKGAQPGTSTNTVKPGTKVDMSKMTYDELAAYIESNPDVE